MQDFDPVESIAVIGMSGRFPGASSTRELWENLTQGIESITRFSAEELLATGLDPRLLEEPGFVPAGGIVEDIEQFDAPFFGFSPRDAELLDPQQRLFLECAWESLEDAGYVPDTFQGLIGVYAGSSMSTYALHLYQHGHMLGLDDFEILISNDKDYLGTRTSYKLNLHGPSVSVQTACSTSLVAITMAVQSLRNFDCDLALAGGVTIGVPQKQGYLYREGGIPSPDGHCRAFDAAAKGTVGGDGVGVVVLKRLSDAIDDGDHIYSVVKGAAINNDGSSKVGYTAPSVSGQSQVIAMAQAQANVTPDSIQYIEAHGTGTPLGDPIEIAALKQVFGQKALPENSCAIGALKTNLGHLDSAAGVAGFIKTVMALHHKGIPASLHFKSLNPEINFNNTPFYINTEYKPWPKKDNSPRRAGVSSFGIGGTNAHVVLEEAPSVPESEDGHALHVITLSARSKTALARQADNLAEFLKNHPGINIADVAYTHQVGRQSFDHRRTVVCRDVDEAIQLLKQPAATSIHHVTSHVEPNTVFMFSGQGSQYLAMGAGLYRNEPYFRDQLDKCSKLLESSLQCSLTELVFSPTKTNDAEQKLANTGFTQPALFALEYALAQLWMSWGIKPKALIGHSSGELVAACIAGVYSLEDGLAMVCERGRLMESTTAGAMLSVPLPEEEIAANLDNELVIAAVNTTSLCSVSGPTAAIERFEKELLRRKIECKRIHTSHAFHSPAMQQVAEEFETFMVQFPMYVPAIPIVSNVTGSWLTDEQATDPAYWSMQLRHQVRYADGIQGLLADPNALFIEIGPGQSLVTMAKMNHGGGTKPRVYPSLPQANQEKSDVASIMETLAQLWLLSVHIDWANFHGNHRRRRLPLPPYPFERQSYWIEPIALETPPVEMLHEGKQPDIDRWFYTPAWTRTPMPQTVKDNDLAQKSLDWLIFTDEQGLLSKMADRLCSAGHKVTLVNVGSGFAQNGDFHYTVAAGDAQDYLALIKQLKQTQHQPQLIVHGWTLADKTAIINDFDQCQELGCYSLIWLAQALNIELIGEQIEILVISNQTVDVSGVDDIAPEKATLLTPCKGIAQEYPNIFCRYVDIDVGQVGCDRLMDELLQECDDSVVALRHKSRWVQSYLPLEMPGIDIGTLPLRKHGVYLISGGLGNIGMLFAQYLAENVQAKIVLLGRTALPARDQWEVWLRSHDPSDPVSSKINHIKVLESAGAEVLVATTDIANREQLKAVIKKIHEVFGDSIAGVIHAAGFTGDSGFQVLQNIDRPLCEKHFQGKVKGLLNLHELIGEDKMDFWVLMSSISTELIGLGFIPYAAANKFLDAFAEKRNQSGTTPWTSIDWDGWDFTSDEFDEDIGLTIKPAEGLEAFQRILSRKGISPIIVSTGDLMLRLNQWTGPSAEAESIENAALENLHERPEMESAYQPPRDEVESSVIETWQSLLGIRQIGIHDNFFELGGHSLLAIQLTSRLRQIFHVEVSVQHIFDAPTIAELAEIVKQQPMQSDMDVIQSALDQVESLSEEELEVLLNAQGSLDNMSPFPLKSNK